MKSFRLFDTLEEYNKSTRDYPNVCVVKEENASYAEYLPMFEDLGLTSGTLWMKYNIGARTETDYGLYFQRGATVGYKRDDAMAHSVWLTCPGNGGNKYYTSASLTEWDTANTTNGVLNKDVDAAYVYTNGKAYLPTVDQIKELVNETTKEWVADFNGTGIAGEKFTSKVDTSKYIFIPAGGCFIYGTQYYPNSQGYLWSTTSKESSNTSAYDLMFHSSACGSASNIRAYAFSVRGVFKPIEFVDLGLESGTKWMKYNIGATSESDYGLYFQYGDTVGHDSSEAASYSSWSTCPANGGNSDYNETAFTTWQTAHLTNGILNNDVDAAYVHTEGQAKMPTQAQLAELLEGTNHEWTSVNGVNGRKFSNKNDATKYIFIPASGYYLDSASGGFNVGVNIWSSSINTSEIYSTYYMNTRSDIYRMTSGSPRNGFAIRGVQV